MTDSAKEQIDQIKAELARLNRELESWSGRVGPDQPPSAESQLTEQQLKIARAAGLSPERYLELYREQQGGA